MFTLHKYYLIAPYVFEHLQEILAVFKYQF